MIIALVTGGNAGIGEAVVRQLAKTSGFHVIIGSRNAESGLRLVGGRSVSSVQLAFVSDESICKAVEQINDKYGKLDVLVNNAGILIDLSPDAFTSTREFFRTTFETNVFGTAVLSEAALPLLLKAEYPHIIFVSSLMGSLEARS
ncbi:hypothetical protein LZ30DRAFT_772735 [Colletotrichum cereale]|nr:hypothetical protein LZ30DRAFT_772735 [Colletotrichum cereale]